jgi:hypothetical protein
VNRGASFPGGGSTKERRRHAAEGTLSESDRAPHGGPTSSGSSGRGGRRHRHVVAAAAALPGPPLGDSYTRCGARRAPTRWVDPPRPPVAQTRVNDALMTLLPARRPEIKREIVRRAAAPGRGPPDAAFGVGRGRPRRHIRAVRAARRGRLGGARGTDIASPGADLAGSRATGGRSSCRWPWPTTLAIVVITGELSWAGSSAPWVRSGLLLRRSDVRASFHLAVGVWRAGLPSRACTPLSARAGLPPRGAALVPLFGTVGPAGGQPGRGRTTTGAAQEFEDNEQRTDVVRLARFSTSPRTAGARRRGWPTSSCRCSPGERGGGSDGRRGRYHPSWRSPGDRGPVRRQDGGRVKPRAVRLGLGPPGTTCDPRAGHVGRCGVQRLCSSPACCSTSCAGGCAGWHILVGSSLFIRSPSACTAPAHQATAPMPQWPTALRRPAAGAQLAAAAT